MKLSLPASVVLMLSIVACGDRLITPDQADESIDDYATILGLWEAESYAIFELSSSRSTFPGRSSFGSGIAEVRVVGKDSSRWAGTAVVNGVTLIANSDPFGNTWYSHLPFRQAARQVRVPLTFGEYQTFSLSGNSFFGAVNDSIEAPAKDLIVSYPGGEDTVSKSTGFTITWNGGDADIITLGVTGAHDRGFPKNYIPDNGRCLISPAELSAFPPGLISIFMTRKNYKLGMNAEGKKYLLVVYSIHSITTTLVE